MKTKTAGKQSKISGGKKRVKKLLNSSYAVFLKDERDERKAVKKRRKGGKMTDQDWRQMGLEEFFTIIYANGYELQIRPRALK